MIGKRNKFNLSNYKLLSCNMGKLVPIGLQEVLPGDTFQQQSSCFLRLSPLLAPVMHPVKVRIHHFFVPTRLIWTDFKKFITGGSDGLDATVAPYIDDAGGIGVGELEDYLAVPTLANAVRYSALPVRAYQLIFQEYFRDKDLTTAPTIALGNGADTTTTRTLQSICWEKDYLTSARPTAEKGSEIVIPFQNSVAPVLGIGKVNQTWAGPYAGVFESDGTTSTYDEGTPIDPSSADYAYRVQEGDASLPGSTEGYPWIRADLSNVPGSMNDLRLAAAVHRFQEARSIYGSDYNEYLRYLGIKPSDARLQRPEYLGGGVQTVQFSEVLQTGVTTDGDDTEGVGNLKGHGISAARSNKYRRFFEEHGFVLTLLSVRPKTIYSEGMPKMFARGTRLDYHQRELEHIGQEEIYKKEVYYDAASPDGVWGYQDRYDTYRRTESTIAGEFRTTLNYWHMARILGAPPTLNSAFVTCDPTTRIYADTTSHQLYVMANHKIIARRMLAKIPSPRIF